MESNVAGSAVAGASSEQGDSYFNLSRIIYTLDLEDKPWFGAAEIVNILGSDCLDPNALLSNVDSEDQINYCNIKRKFVNVDDHLPLPNSVFISENGLFSLIDLSNLPTVNSFKKMIICEFLPLIRRIAHFHFEKKLELTVAEAAFWKGECEKSKNVITSLQSQLQILVTESNDKDLAMRQHAETVECLKNRVQTLEVEIQQAKNGTVTEVNSMEISPEDDEIGHVASDASKAADAAGAAMNDTSTLQHLVQDLESAIRGKNLEICWLRRNAEVLTQQIGILENAKTNHTAEIEQYQTDSERLKQTIQVLETENSSNAAVLMQYRSDFEVMKRKIQALEIINRTDAEKLEHVRRQQEIGNCSNENQMERESNDDLQVRVRYLEMKNLTKNTMIKQDIKEIQNLKEQVRVLKSTEKTYKQALTEHSVIFNQLRINFTPMTSRQYQERFYIFRLNDESIHTHYVIRAQTRKILSQIRNLRLRHPNCLEIICIPYYPNAVNLFHFIKSRLRGSIRFKGNYFSFIQNKYTETNLLTDLRKMQKDADYLSSVILRTPRNEQLTNL